MPDAQPQRARKRARRTGDHHVVARVKPDQTTDMVLLAEALMLHAQEQRAKANGSPVPHLAGTHKLAAGRADISEEGDDE